jgi:hypothetical protein
MKTEPMALATGDRRRSKAVLMDKLAGAIQTLTAQEKRDFHLPRWGSPIVVITERSRSLLFGFVNKRFVIRREDPHIAEFDRIAVVLKKDRAGHGLFLLDSNHVEIGRVAVSKRVKS